MPERLGHRHRVGIVQRLPAVCLRLAHAQETELPHFLEHFVRREDLGCFPFVYVRIDFRFDELLQLPLQLFVLVRE